jgi:CRP-like cAMP-binding protein
MSSVNLGKFEDAPALAGVVAEMKTVPAGGMVFRQGDRSRGIFLLLSGSVRLQRTTPDGTAVTLHQVRSGETFAEASLFGDRYHCDAVAETECRVGRYPKAGLATALRGDPESMWRFAAELARSLQHLRSRYELRQIRSAPERVVQFLRLQCDADGGYAPPGTLRDLAGELGMTQEAMYRALASLERNGRLTRADGWLRLAPACR